MGCKIVNVTLSRTLVTFTMSKEKKKGEEDWGLETERGSLLGKSRRPCRVEVVRCKKYLNCLPHLAHVLYSTAHVSTKNGKRALGMGQ